MKTEYEVRIIEINKEEVIERLEKLGATKVGEFNYRRYVYDFNPAQYEKWIRLRTDGKQTTLTIKEITDYGIEGTKETEIEVSDFDITNEILEKLGYVARGYQENNRIRYMLDNVEIDIDTWPSIPTYLEIEGKCSQDVVETIEKLGLKKGEVVSLDVQSMFEKKYNIDLDKIDKLTFNKK